MLRSARRAVKHFISSSVLPFAAKSRVGGFGVIRTHKIVLRLQTLKPTQSSALALTQSMLHSKKLFLVPKTGPSLHLLPDSVKLQYRLAIVHIQLMKQGSSFVLLITFFIQTNSSPLSRAHIARWCAESNRPMNIVKDREFLHLMKAGRPGTSLPTPATVARDVKLSFKRCCERINKIIMVCFNLYAD